jgi:hypothetical protein
MAKDKPLDTSKTTLSSLIARAQVQHTRQLKRAAHTSGTQSKITPRQSRHLSANKNMPPGTAN